MGNDLPKEESETLVQTTLYKKAELKKWYKSFKKEHPKGALNRQQFDVLYHELFYTEEENPAKIDQLFRVFDRNNDGEISFKDLVTTLSILKRGPIKEKMEWLFDIYDIDGNGEISKEELEQIFASMRNNSSVKFNADKMNAIFESLDTSKDGFVTKEEFIAGIQSHPELGNLLNQGQTLSII